MIRPGLKWWIGGSLLLLYLLSGIYMVGSDEMGVVVMFGKVIENHVPPGIHYRLPWPLTTVNTPQVTAIRRMSIGYEILKQLQEIPPSREEANDSPGI